LAAGDDALGREGARLIHDLGFVGDDQQQHPGSLFRLTPALLPVPNGSGAETEPERKCLSTVSPSSRSALAAGAGGRGVAWWRCPVRWAARIVSIVTRRRRWAALRLQATEQLGFLGGKFFLGENAFLPQVRQFLDLAENVVRRWLRRR
jgi:hypothetical protein